MYGQHDHLRRSSRSSLSIAPRLFFIDRFSLTRAGAVGEQNAHHGSTNIVLPSANKFEEFGPLLSLYVVNRVERLKQLGQSVDSRKSTRKLTKIVVLVNSNEVDKFRFVAHRPF